MDKQTRESYERGLNEAKLPEPEKTIHDIARVGQHSDAFWKGRNEEQLDADKKSK